MPGEKKVYVLDMFPYPSGEGLHVGHPKGYIATDIYSRFKRMNGFDVLHPMGWDAFGLPAEQYALKNKVHPRVATEKNVARYKEQLCKLGVDYDWKREINTTDPEFYKWTQWIFTKLYEKGLAYESNEPINWCPSCKTGLANEDLDGDKCERCDSIVEKKPIRQWVLRITDYADRMLADLDTLNWPEGVKTAQKNWIGRSEGAEFDFKLVDCPLDSVRVFTTRADTLYGATFVAVSAELASVWFDQCLISGSNIATYIKNTLEEQKKEVDYSVIPEKTGIFSGIYAINPATQEKIPVWIANYVLGGVGTGAIMAVPAHDDRDYDFATKYKLPIKQVVMKEFGLPSSLSKNRDIVKCLLFNTKGEVLLLKSSKGFYDLPGGGCDGEDISTSIKREIREETGYSEIVFDTELGKAFINYSYKNNEFKKGIVTLVKCTLLSEKKEEVSFEEHESFVNVWTSEKEAMQFLKKDEDVREQAIVQIYEKKYFTEDGISINSDTLSGLSSSDAKVKAIEAFNGKKVVKYKIQDWVFARQRYWGEPFPVVRDASGKVYMVDESELPVLLPDVESYEPTGTGESPLAAITDWVNVQGYITEKGTFKQSSDGKIFKRETNTMPQWAGSSWYYLRFLDPHNDKALIDPIIEKTWGKVDVYVGGDHATRHLIYARFWHKFLYDIGVVSTIEPFSRLEFLGFILSEDGRKMSKRWGNVINPDDVVAEYGADTLRVYEMFMAPFEQTVAWSTSSIKGSDKFLDRVYSLYSKIGTTSTVTVELHKTIKKATEDIENFKFNTAISQMMILVNAMESGEFTQEDYATFLQVLAPFAPHLTEEIWSLLGNKESIHTSVWPTYDEKFLITNEVTLAIQIGGKMRGTIVIARDSDDEAVKNLIKSHEMYKKYVGDMEPKKVIIVKNKIVNIVI
jgi:leucyl-tRNA synthetase